LFSPGFSSWRIGLSIFKIPSNSYTRPVWETRGFEVAYRTHEKGKKLQIVPSLAQKGIPLPRKQTRKLSDPRLVLSNLAY